MKAYLHTPCCSLLAALTLLAACAPESTPTTTAAEQAPAPAPLAAASPDTGGVTLAELMKDTVQPNVDTLWRSVSYVANAQGVTETKPETDEDWSQLRDSANALIEAGNELMDTNREIVSGASGEATASFQYTPDEIRQLLADNPEPWQAYIEQMQEFTRMTLQAIELKDVLGLQDFGARINAACEGCHADYWYRPPEELVPR